MIINQEKKKHPLFEVELNLSISTEEYIYLHPTEFQSLLLLEPDTDQVIYWFRSWSKFIEFAEHRHWRLDFDFTYTSTYIKLFEKAPKPLHPRYKLNNEIYLYDAITGKLIGKHIDKSYKYTAVCDHFLCYDLYNRRAIINQTIASVIEYEQIYKIITDYDQDTNFILDEEVQTEISVKIKPKKDTSVKNLSDNNAMKYEIKKLTDNIKRWNAAKESYQNSDIDPGLLNYKLNQLDQKIEKAEQRLSDNSIL